MIRGSAGDMESVWKTYGSDMVPKIDGRAAKRGRHTFQKTKAAQATAMPSGIQSGGEKKASQARKT